MSTDASPSRAPDAPYYEQRTLWGTDHIENEAHLSLRYAAIDELLPAATGSLIEVGSGDGRVLDHLESVRPDLRRIVGLDRSIAALVHQRRPVLVGSVDDIPVHERAADAVLCCEVLEHLPFGTYAEARAEIARVADRWVVVTVPNRENRKRSAVRCPHCGCEYSPILHLRSFDPSDMHDLIPGFRLYELREAGPRIVVYPRVVRRLLERTGIVQRSGAPTCPQCAAPFTSGAPRRVHRSGGADRGRLKTTSTVVRSLVPKSRRRYWLCALYERVDAI